MTDENRREVTAPSEASTRVITSTQRPRAGAAVLRSPRPIPAARPQGMVLTQSGGGSCPTCAQGAENAGPAVNVYALGTLEMRFPSPGVEKEFRQCIAGGNTANLTESAVQHNALREFRHLANEVCWVFRIENVDTYVLIPRDNTVLDDFVNAVAPSEKKLDVDVIIGNRGPMAPAEMCNGLVVPIVLVDRIYSFQQPELMGALTKPESLTMTDAEFANSAATLFERIQQMADNVGATDEHRALNYLSVRSERIYALTSEMYGKQCDLTDVQVASSRLSGARKLVDVILSYTNRTTDVAEKYYVRVDVSEKYPFVDKALAQYYDRH